MGQFLVDAIVHQADVMDTDPDADLDVKPIVNLAGQLVDAVFASTNPEIPDQDLAYEYDALGNRIRTILNGITTLLKMGEMAVKLDRIMGGTFTSKRLQYKPPGPEQNCGCVTREQLTASDPREVDPATVRPAAHL